MSSLHLQLAVEQINLRVKGWAVLFSGVRKGKNFASWFL